MRTYARFARPLASTLATLALLGGGTAHAAATHVIHFLVAHEPANQQLNSAMKDFAEAIARDSNGELKVELAYYPENVPGTFETAALDIYNGKYEMSQIGTQALSFYAPSLKIFDLPFLFDDHKHVRSVIDGKVGEALKKDLLDGSDHRVRSLAFTYSGGFRNFIADREIRSAADLKGLKAAVPSSVQELSTLDSMGIETLLVPGIWSVGKKTAAEALRTKQVNFYVDDTQRLSTVFQFFGKDEESRSRMRLYTGVNQSIFLTSLVINEKFFQSLPEKLRKVLARNVLQAAEREREISIELADQHVKQRMSEGFKVEKASPELIQQLKRATSPVLAKFSRMAPWSLLVKQVRGLQKSGFVAGQ